ncbi:MAG: outer membrane protein assembly factor [Cryomorphaceae bacterium]|nr:outer membrane protein assembly factor [Cryomorphaceae bacterium]
MTIKLFIGIIGLSIFSSFGDIHAQLNDTLPFAISEGKRLSDSRLAKKKEGFYVTGLPRFAYDPIQGFGIGVDAEIFNNGNRNDPFFAYTPYRQRYKVSVWAAENGKIAAKLGADIPYIFNTKWRFRSTFSFADNPNKLYFGMGEAFLSPFDESPFNGSAPFYGDYLDELRTIRPGNPVGAPEGMRDEDPTDMYSDRRLHYLQYRKYALDLVLERSFFDGDLRVLGVLGFTHLVYRHYDFETIDDALDADGNDIDATSGITQVTRDFYASERNDPDSYWRRRNIMGYEGGLSVKFKAGVIYDTRDFEPDPYKGLLLEYGMGATDQIIGSDFSYMRHMLQAQGFLPLFTWGRNQLQSTLAGRAAFSVIHGQDIFFREIFDVWSASQGRIGLLGGEDNLRGYKKFRFGAPVYGFGSVEWRTQFANFSLFDQDWIISAVPFADAGRVWDELGNVGLRGFRYNGGLGLRIHWNQSTIIRLDYAVSAEDRQFFLVFGQMF